MVAREALLVGAAGVLLLTSAALAQAAESPQVVVQRVVDAERAANARDHTNWIYYEESQKPKEQVRQWVAATQRGEVRRVIERNGERLDPPRQRDLAERLAHDPGAQKKVMAEASHDSQQVDDLLKLLPVAFRWTVTSVTPQTTSLHFEPTGEFHPPSREAKVFGGMVGDLVADNQQHRVQSMRGHLIHDVNFGGGLLGRLKEGSSFSLEQVQLDDAVWELRAIHVHLEGNALIFKSVSLQEDDERSKFKRAPSELTLEEAAAVVMSQPE